MPKVVGLERQVRGMSTAGETDGWDLLRKRLQIPWRVAGLLEDLARKVLQLPWEREVPTVSDGG
jgi:hypothetical protein